MSLLYKYNPKDITDIKWNYNKTLKTFTIYLKIDKCPFSITQGKNVLLFWSSGGGFTTSRRVPIALNGNFNGEILDIFVDKYNQDMTEIKKDTFNWLKSDYLVPSSGFTYNAGVNYQELTFELEVLNPYSVWNDIKTALDGTDIPAFQIRLEMKTNDGDYVYKKFNVTNDTRMK